MTDKTQPAGLALMRVPFPAHQISKLPKPTKRQTEEVRADFKKGARCEVCGGWHHPNVVHLDYVGHAALTDRLLDCDPNWNWEPVALAEDGSPALDANGGMWIRLTVCGVTRLGYGHPDGKRGGDAIKEVIGDALRNAAMRFGAALDLWHKGDLHGDDEDDASAAPRQQQRADTGSNVESFDAAKEGRRIMAAIEAAPDVAALDEVSRSAAEAFKRIDKDTAEKIRTAAAAKRTALTVDDSIPY